MPDSKQNVLDKIGQISKDTQRNNDEVKAKIKSMIKEKNQEGMEFPIHAFPKRLQAVLESMANCYGLPIDFYGLGALTVASSLIGNSYNVHFLAGWTVPPIVYSAIVGPSSMGKSPAMKFCLKPIYSIEDEYRAQYLEDIETWKQECFNIQSTNSRQPEPPKPQSREILLSDATIESISSSMTRNPRGLLLFRDELTGWVNSLNQYRKGSDTEFYLQNWSNVSSKINRVSKDPLFIRKPFLNVLGGITPAVLETLAGDGKQDNGFLARILFAYPDDQRAPHLSTIQPDPANFDIYQDIMDFLNKLPTKITPPETEYHDWTIESIGIHLEERAFKAYRFFYDHTADQMNRMDNDTQISIYGKMREYCLRFALILELLNLACENLQFFRDRKRNPIYDVEGMERITIKEDSILRAIALVDYFKYTSRKVLARFESPVAKLSSNKQAWYESLPETFDYQSAVEVGAAAKMSESTVKRMLKDRILFSKLLGRGEYEKNF
jgi:hypothetical protein